MNKLLLIFVGLLLVNANLMAQGEGNVTGGEHFIHGVFNPTISDAFKLMDKPILFDSIVEVKPVQYQMLTVKSKTVLRLDTIKPARLRMKSNLKKLYKGYAKAGIGLYTTPLVEVYFNETRSRKGGYGLKVKHFSSNGGLNDVCPSAYSDNNVDIWGKKFYKEHALDGSFFYNRNVVNFYGYEPALVPDSIAVDEDLQKQRFNHIGAQGGWKSYYKDSAKVNHTINVRYYNLQDKFGSQENNVLFDSEFNKYRDQELYAVEFSADVNNYIRDERTGGQRNNTNTILRFLPNISTTGKNYKVLVGLGIFIEAMNQARFHFYPHAEFRYSLFDDLIIPYAGITGSTDRNSLKNITDENPFVVSDVELRNTNKKFDIYGGFRGTISSKSAFNAFISYKQFEDQRFFVMDTLTVLANRFDVVYDEMDVFTIGGELSYDDGEKLALYTRAEVNTYNTDRQAEAWNLPGFKLTFGGTYDLRDKIIIKAELKVLGERKAASIVANEGEVVGSTPFTRTLEPFFDMYLGLEYRYTKRLSVFLDMSNLTAANYELWYNYPTQRFLLMGGATYSF